MEVGPGRGNLIRELQKLGAEVYAADLVRTYLQALNLQPSHINTFDIQNSRALPSDWLGLFDVVVMTDVLEHLTHPQDALLVVSKLLKENGRIYVRVPCHESLIRYAREIGCPHKFAHLRTYNRRILRTEFVATGFRPLRGPRYLRTTSRQPNTFLARSIHYSRWQRDGLIRLWETSNSLAHTTQKSPPGERALFFNAKKFLLTAAMKFLSSPGEVWCLAQATGNALPVESTHA